MRDMRRCGRARAALAILVLDVACGSGKASSSVTYPPPWATAGAPSAGSGPVAAASASGSGGVVADVRPAPRSPWALGLPKSAPSPAPVPDLWQYTRWKQKKVITVGKSHLYVSRLSPDERYVLVISEIEFAVRIYELASGKLAYKHQLTGYTVSDNVDAVFWPDTAEGLRFVLAGKEGVTLRDAASGAVVERLWDRPTRAVGWSPDEKVLVASRSGIPPQRSDLVFLVRGPGHTLRTVGEVGTEDRVSDWALSGDNQRLVTIGFSHPEVELRRLDTGQQLWSVPEPNYAAAVAISPDGAWVAVGGDHLLLIDAHNPERRSYYGGFKNNINTVVFSRSSDVVIASSYDGRIRILRNDVRTGTLTLIQELRHAGTANVYSLSLFRDGSGMVSSSGDQTVRWWGI
jgi:WD40 repeat protein